MAIFDDVKAVVVEQLNVNEGEIKPESRFVEDLGADSLDVVELVMALEEKFDINVPDEDAEKNSNCWGSGAYYEKEKKKKNKGRLFWMTQINKGKKEKAKRNQ